MEKELNVDTENQASDLEKLALKVWEESTIEAAKDNFMKDGELHAMVFIALEQEGKIIMGIMPVGEFMRNTGTKDALTGLMKHIGEKMTPVAISLVTEMWMVEGISKEEVTAVPPSQHPDRVEGILCTFESENIQTQKMFKIIREPELGLEPLDKGPDAKGMNMTGRFVNILKDMKKARNN